jgi:oligoribonuclease
MKDALYSDTNLVWMDLEMTGLQPEVNRILEMAVLITDAQLNVIAESPVYVVHQDPQVIAEMDAWNTATHTQSGLVKKVSASLMDEKAVEACALDFISRYVPAGKSPLCGNSIGQDRRFLARWMPDLERYMHYRNIDVSSFKEVVKRWAPEKLKEYRKSSRHEALADIYDSIEELKFYRSKVMTI